MNVIGPKGFVPSRYLNGAAWNGACNMYVIPAADINQFRVGDAVKSAANGDANGIPAVTKALGTDTVRGVIIGVLLANPNNPSLVGTVLDNTIQNIDPKVQVHRFEWDQSDPSSWHRRFKEQARQL